MTDAKLKVKCAIRLSKRLEAVAALVGEGLTLADIGTDHAYLPVYLVSRGKCPRAIAVDAGEEPLSRAARHIRRFGLEDRIETRLSDGAAALRPNECESLVLAGMGGRLVIRIMSEGRDVFAVAREIILQPQSEVAKVRKYLEDAGYIITAEDMVTDGGKFYPIIKAVCGGSAPGCQSEDVCAKKDGCRFENTPKTQNHDARPYGSDARKSEKYSETELRYGRFLLRNRHPVLELYLRKELHANEKLIGELSRVEHMSENAKRGLIKLRREAELINEALEFYR